MQRNSFYLIALLLGISTVLLSRPESTPAGLWLTFDEKNGDTLAIVEITDGDAGMSGKISKLFLRPHQGDNGRCVRCEEDEKNHPLRGLRILQDFYLKKDKWEKGRLLNPADGKTYAAQLWLEDSLTLKVRSKHGPLGILRHTQTWRRVDGGNSDSPAGKWEVLEERFGEVSAMVKVSIEDGKLQGRILKTFLLPNEGPDARCTACKDSLHNAKIVGLEILSELTLVDGKWQHGRILDPGNGKTYRCSMWLESADRLKVRGHLGPFSRTQIWHRLEEK